MSSDLSNREFPETANSGALNWLFEGFRTRMRDTAKFVRMEAAWRTWPTIHRISKGLHERLISPADTQAERQEFLHDHAKRCADMYPTEAHLQAAIKSEGLRRVSMSIGALEEDNPNFYGVTLDDVLEVYRDEYAISAAEYEATNPLLTAPVSASHDIA